MIKFRTSVSMVICGFLLTAVAPVCHALDLIGAYQAAEQNDPTYKEAIAAYNENKEAVPQARSIFFPQISVGGNLGQDNVKGSNISAQGFNISLSQTLFNYQAYKRYKGAKATVIAAEFTLSAAQQDLILRTATAYFRVLEAQDLARYTRLEQLAVLNQVNTVRERLKVGHATVTALNQARGTYDLLTAEYATAKNEVFTRKQELHAITGIPIDKLAHLKGSLPLSSPKPSSVADWVEKAGTQNLLVSAAAYQVETALHEMQASKFARAPIINGEVSYADQQSASVTSSGATAVKSDSFFYGLNVEVPAFQGGLLQSQYRASIAAYQAAQAARLKAYRDATTQARRSYQTVLYKINAVRAGRRAVVSNRRALADTLEGFKNGTETMLDVLTQQRQLYNAQKTLATDRYEYILNGLSLLDAVGVLKPESIAALNNYLATKRPRTKRVGIVVAKKASPVKQVVASKKAVASSTLPPPARMLPAPKRTS